MPLKVLKDVRISFKLFSAAMLYVILIVQVLVMAYEELMNVKKNLKKSTKKQALANQSTDTQNE